jgi:hypothetical protein
VILGRHPQADVCLPWDPRISRLHAELIQRAGLWVLADDGLSQNGTLLNGLPVAGRRRLRDGDLITVGNSSLTFCEASADDQESQPLDPDITMALPAMRPAWHYSQQQQDILRELCRPLCADGDGVQPATDRDIAQALSLAEQAVARELDAVAESFDYGELALDERRLRTALTALRSGLVDGSD